MADLSHWINVAETDTTDPDLTQVIEDLAHQTYHVHCRVGYDHGPQVFFQTYSGTGTVKRMYGLVVIHTISSSTIIETVLDSRPNFHFWL